MKQYVAIAFLAFGICQTAEADVWKWVDILGKTHYVDTMKPIYTWLDDDDKLHYSDTPDHEDAVLVQLVWHSRGPMTVASETDVKEEDRGYAFDGETDEDRALREETEAHYCKRATEIYDSYLNAPKLYKTGAEGERVFLSEADAATTIAETKAKKDELCN